MFILLFINIWRTYATNVAKRTPRDSGLAHPASALFVLGLLLMSSRAGAASGGSAGDLPPVAVITSPASDLTVSSDGPTSVHFNGSASRDPDGALLLWSWDFGDGTSGRGMTTDHTYNASGLYTVVLAVTDDRGLSSLAVCRIALSRWADLGPSITSPPDGAVLTVGETAFFEFSLAPGAPLAGLAARWDFGDGTVAAVRSGCHAYSRPGFYTVRLSVASLWGVAATTSVTVLVRPSPAARTELSWKGDTEVSGERVLDNCQIELSGNLTVSGELTLTGTELAVRCPANGTCGIRVVRGGRLVLAGGTTVRSSDPAARFSFRVLPGAGLTMLDSRLSGCGWISSAGGVEDLPADMGLYIESNEAVISRCRISGNAVGVVVDHGASPAISDSDISRNDGWGIRAFQGSAPLVQGNLLRGNGLLAPISAGRPAAISSRSSSPTIFNNTILADPAAPCGRAVHGIVLIGPGRPEVAQNSIIGHHGDSLSAGITSSASAPYIHDNTLLANSIGLELSGGSARVERNTVTGGPLGAGAHPTTGLSDGSTSAFSGNSFYGFDYGARFQNGTRSTFEKDEFRGDLNGIECRSSAVPFHVELFNCTFADNFRDVLVSRPAGLSSPGRLSLVNCAYDPSRVVLDDPEPVVSVGWFVGVLVLDGETLTPVTGAAVGITGHGRMDQGFFMTGSDGRTGPVGLESRAFAPGFAQDRTPYVLVASKDGVSSVEWPLELSGPCELTLLLRRESTSVAVRAGDGDPLMPVLAAAGAPVNLTALGVPEPGDDALSYHWDFGDGKAGSGPEGTHIYENAGKYNVVLTVTRGDLVMVGVLRVEVRAAPARPASGPFPGSTGLLALGLCVIIGVAWFVGFTEVGLFGASWALMLLYSKIARTKVLDNFLRGKIYGYILANPGDHYNSIMDALKLSNGTFAYHIRMLEREKLVKSLLDGVYKRFFPAEMIVPDSDRIELTRIQKIICDIIAEKPGINQRDVAALLNLSSATINYHIDTLIRKNHVRRERVGMKVRYYPVPTGRLREDGQLASMLTPPL